MAPASNRLRSHAAAMLFGIWDWLRERTLKRSHRRRIRQARRVLVAVRGILSEQHGAARAFGYLRKIDPLTMEELVLEVFCRHGHRVRRNRRYTGDGGVDGYVQINRAWCPIQCKRYKNAIDPGHVRAFVAVVAHQGATHGFFVHTGRTGPTSREVARSNPTIRIVSGEHLLQLIGGATARFDITC